AVSSVMGAGSLEHRLCALLSPGVGAQAGQPFKLHQPQSKVSVLAGQTLTLNCTTSGVGSPGAVRWLKGWDSGNKTIYDQRNEPQPQPRVMRAVVGSNTDFTIHIRDVQPEDMGTYYCVKFRKGILGVEEVFQRGSGTEVSVQGEWGSWSSSWLHEPEKSSDAMTQESDPNNLTYADLNFDKERKTIRRMVEMSQQSEYACIQTNQAPNSDDNLTYADLDMVHLSKAPKRPAPRPEEAGSEYASVQIPRK
uniref:Ig-like domain-containing protein n=1 Tax=Malurus cyaneus samueli TaxID=2593467 RepID=A0A8C5U3Q6_9PASS